MGDLPNIKWLRLRRLAEQIAGCPVRLHGSTELPAEMRAAVESAPGKMDIVLNFQHIKSAEMAIKAVAHEVAHVILGNAQHDNVFKSKWEEVEQLIKKDYYRDV